MTRTKDEADAFYKRSGQAAVDLLMAAAKARQTDDERIYAWHRFKGDVEKAVAGGHVGVVLVLRRETPSGSVDREGFPRFSDTGCGIRVCADGAQADVSLVAVGWDADEKKASWAVLDAEVLELALCDELSQLGTSEDVEDALLVATEELARLLRDNKASGGQAHDIAHLIAKRAPAQDPA